MEHDDETRLCGGVGTLEVEIETELPRGRLVVASGNFADEDEWSLFLPEDDLVLLGALQRNGFADEQGLPVQTVDEGVLLGDNATFQVGTSLGIVVDENNGISLWQGGIEWIVADQGKI